MKKTIKLLVLGILFSVSANTFGQHDHHNHADTAKPESKHDMANMDSTHHHKTGGDMPPMTHAFSLNLAMTRNGSGTGWLPDSTPMYGYMVHGKKWMYMFHGNIF